MIAGHDWYKIAHIRAEKNPSEKLNMELAMGFWSGKEYLREVSKRIGVSSVNLKWALIQIGWCGLQRAKNEAENKSA